MTVALLVLVLALAATVVALFTVVRRANATRAALEADKAALERRLDRATRHHERIELALDTIPEGVLVYDAEGDLVHRNEPAGDYLAARHSEALVGDAIATLAERALTGEGGTQSVDLFGPPRRTLVLTAAPLGDREGVVGAIVVIDDVSERRRLENVRRDFVANISHELKTPVGALSLLAETLLSEDDPAVGRRLAERLLAEALRVGRTIDDLLELSRIEADESAPADPLPVHVLVAEAIDRVEPAADQRHIALQTDEPDPRVTVIGDRRQLVSALFNLLENAVKYSDDDSIVQVRVSTNGTWVDVRVIDHGVGIPQRDLERVFERFYRVDRARSRQTGGTGLGLAIVRHVAANHQGEVRVESREGEGSTFTLRLPAGPGPVAVTAEAG